jgi:thymidine phosphorylase
VTVALAAEMLLLGRVAESRQAATAAAAAALDDGRALERMRRIVEAQGGNPAVLDDPALLPQAPVQRVYEAAAAGHLTEVDALVIGRAAVALGAGRAELGAVIDPAVGFHITAKPGARVERGEPLATVHARTEADAEAGLDALQRALRIGPEPRAPLPLISHRVTSAGVEPLAAAGGAPPPP